MTAPHLTATLTPGGERVLVLGPSLGTSTVLWQRALPLLAPRARLLAWDLPGHGASRPAEAPFSVADLAEGVVRLADSEGIERFAYAGVSLGGATGLELALRYPDRMSALVVVCSSAKFGEASAWTDRARTMRAQGTPVLVGQSALRWFAPESITRFPEITGRLLNALADADDESYALCCEALAGYDVRGRLAEIAVPTLAIYGEYDTVAPSSDAEAIGGGVRHGAVARIGDASHLAPAEQPDAVVAAITRFLDDPDRDERR
jgi:3-oxoadipate enol-lactonase